MALTAHYLVLIYTRCHPSFYGVRLALTIPCFVQIVIRAGCSTSDLFIGVYKQGFRLCNFHRDKFVILIFISKLCR